MKGYILPNQRKSKSDLKTKQNKTKKIWKWNSKYSRVVLVFENNLSLFRNTQLLVSSKYKEWKSFGPKTDTELIIWL